MSTLAPRWLPVLALALACELPASLELSLAPASESSESTSVAPHEALPSPGAESNSAPADALPAALRHAPTGAIPAEVVSITDGDTLRVRVEGQRERVRLIGIDCPEVAHERDERDEAFAAEATLRLGALAGEEVLLVPGLEERDRYGRLLAYVYPRPAGPMINATLVSEGLAWPITVPPNVEHAEPLRELGAQARSAGRGVWGLAPDALPARLRQRLRR